MGCERGIARGAPGKGATMSEDTSYQHRLNRERELYGAPEPFTGAGYAQLLPVTTPPSGEARERDIARRKVERFADDRRPL